MLTQEERMKALVDRAEAKLEYSEGCWVWPGPYSDGYGKVSYRQGKTVKSLYVHRAMFERHISPIPEGMEVHHLCFNTKCARPTHLELRTRAANLEANKELWAEAAAARRAELMAMP